MEHGPIVPKVYQVAQFVPKAVFRQFAKEGSDARRQDDEDPSEKLLIWIIANQKQKSPVLRSFVKNVNYLQLVWENHRIVKKSASVRKFAELCKGSQASAYLCIQLPISTSR